MERALGMPPERQGKGDQMRVADCLKRLGFQKTKPITRSDGVRVRFWVLPENFSKQVDQVDQVDQKNQNPSYQGILATDQPHGHPDQPTDQPPQVDQSSKKYQNEVDHPSNPSTARVSRNTDQPDQPDQPKIKSFLHPSAVGQPCRFIGPNPPNIQGLDQMTITAIEGSVARCTSPRWAIEKMFPLSDLEVIP